MAKISEKDFTGQAAGHLTGIFQTGKTPDGKFPLWICKCHRCGRLALVSASVLNLNRQDTDCGCSKVDRLKEEIRSIESEQRSQAEMINMFYEGLGVKQARMKTSIADLNQALLEVIKAAFEAGRPFTYSGTTTGLWGRRGELGPDFQKISRDKLYAMAKDLLNRGEIVKCIAGGSNAKKWLAAPERKIS